MSSFQYHHLIDLAADNAHTRVIRLVGEGKRVLELGCATGYMSRVLSERFGCTVVGVEIDPAAAERARPACRRVIVGDLETLDLAKEAGDERFDVVVCADVLEHLRQPERTLAAVRGLLAPGGYVVASIPNIAHVAVVAELLQGRFAYRAEGILDVTHVRFFTRESLYRCFEDAGLVVSHLDRVRVEPEETEFRTDLRRLPAELAALLRGHDESTTYQFIVKAEAAADGGGVATLRAAVEGTGRWPPAASATADARPPGLEPMLDALWHRMTFLEEERRQHALALQRLGDDLAHCRQVAERHGHERDEWQAHAREVAERLTAERDQLTGERDQLKRHADAVTGTLAAIHASAGWAVLRRYRAVRLALFPSGSRRERAYQRVLAAVRRAAARR